VISNDYTFSFAGRRFQVARQDVKGANIDIHSPRLGASGLPAVAVSGALISMQHGPQGIEKRVLFE
jgi:hypothetical protein